MDHHRYPGLPFPDTPSIVPSNLCLQCESNRTPHWKKLFCAACRKEIDTDLSNWARNHEDALVIRYLAHTARPGSFSKDVRPEADVGVDRELLRGERRDLGKALAPRGR